MKICRSCKEEIASEATKCPKCQSFQNRFWNSQILAVIPILFFIPFLIFMRPSRGAKFQDYKTEIEIKIINIDTVLIREQQKLNILVEVDNQSEKNWNNPTYEVRYLSADGKLLNLENDQDYQLVVPAKEKVTSSVKVPIYKEYAGATIEVKLTKLSSDRY